THFIGKDITRFHCALWPAMLWAAGEEAPKKVFAHGFVYRKNKSTGEVEKIGKGLGTGAERMKGIWKFSGEPSRYFFLRESRSTRCSPSAWRASCSSRSSPGRRRRSTRASTSGPRGRT